ncbi:MAG: hypothetical protein ACI81V_001291 [Lentimonas sp.]|jgi:hypothetical protein
MKQLTALTIKSSFVTSLLIRTPPSLAKSAWSTPRVVSKSSRTSSVAALKASQHNPSFTKIPAAMRGFFCVIFADCVSYCRRMVAHFSRLGGDCSRGRAAPSGLDERVACAVPVLFAETWWNAPPEVVAPARRFVNPPMTLMCADDSPSIGIWEPLLNLWIELPFFHSEAGYTCFAARRGASGYATN